VTLTLFFIGFLLFYVWIVYNIVFCIKITKNVLKKDIAKVWQFFFEKYGFDLWPKLSHNVTTLDNDDIDISMSHIPSVVTLWDNLGQRSNPYFSKKNCQTLAISFLSTFFVIFIQKTAEVVEKWSRSITP
jgi:hypothetical protein